MLGVVLTRVVTTFLGFIWPAYQCYKDLETAAAPPDRFRQWCVYWVVLVLFSAIERYVDLFFSWLPLFQEAKIAFVYFLAHAGGAAYVYEAVVQPLLLEQEPKIDDVVIKANLWLRTNYNSHIAWATRSFQSKFIDLVALVYPQEEKAAMSPRITTSVEQQPSKVVSPRGSPIKMLRQRMARR